MKKSLVESLIQVLLAKIKSSLHEVQSFTDDPLHV
jgi:hypothetical protein